MKNFVKDFDLVCQTKFAIGLIGSMFFFGEAAGSLFYTLFSVKFQSTRVKHLQLKNFILTFVLFLLTFFIRDLMNLYQMLFIIGLLQAIGIVQGFAYNMEMMPHSYRNLVSTSISCSDKLLFLGTTLFLKFYPTHWVYIMVLGIICSIISCLMSARLLDSP